MPIQHSIVSRSRIKSFESFTRVMEAEDFLYKLNEEKKKFVLTGRGGTQFDKDKLFPKIRHFTNRRRGRNPTHLEPAEEYNVLVHAFGNDPENIKKFLEREIRDELRLLGNGFMGLAFKWNTGKRDKVIKLTVDKIEYRAALKLSKKPIPGIARFHWARPVNLPHRLISPRFGKLAYIICMDMLKQLDSDDETALMIPYFLTGLKYLDPDSSDNEKRVREFLMWLAHDQTDKYQPFIDMGITIPGYWIPNVRRKGGRALMRPQLGGNPESGPPPTRENILGCLGYFSTGYNYVKKSDQNIDFVSEEYKRIGLGRIESLAMQYLSIIKSCKENGIPPDDIHLGNMAFDNGKLVAFDCMGKMSD